MPSCGSVTSPHLPSPVLHDQLPPIQHQPPAPLILLQLLRTFLPLTTRHLSFSHPSFLLTQVGETRSQWLTTEGKSTNAKPREAPERRSRITRTCVMGPHSPWTNIFIHAQVYVYMLHHIHISVRIIRFS